MGLEVPCTNSYTHSESVGIQIVYGIGAPCSVLGSGFILLSALIFPSLRKSTAYPIFMLSLADLFKSILYLANAVGNPGDECVQTAWCSCSGGLRNFFGLATFIFVAAIAGMGYLGTTDRGRTFIKSNAWTYTYAGLGWGVPALSLLIIYTAGNDVIGDVGGKCWITSEYEYLRWLLYYGPLVLVFVFVCVACYATYKNVSAIGVPADIRKRIRDRLMMYSLIFLFVRFWSLLDMIVATANGSDKVYAMVIIHSIFSPWQGFANAYVYGFRNSEVRKHWSNFYATYVSGGENGVQLKDTATDDGNGV